MMTNAFYALLFLATMAFQTSVVASLPEPYRLFPLALVIGVIVLHEHSLAIGTAWLAVAGLVLEARGLGNGLAVAGLGAGAAALGLSLSVFAKRSFWALLGTGLGSATAGVLTRLLWLGLWSLFTGIPVRLGVLARQGLWSIFLAVVGVFLFGAYVRRFLRWSRDKFVSKTRLYDIS